MKVLLVEDHSGLAHISCEFLRKRHGHEVEHAATGQAALESLKKNVPEIVLLDLSLPDMHGYELAKQIRANTAFDQTILVALTGFGLTGNPELSRAVGIDAHFRKPMDFGEVTNIKRVTSSPSSARNAIQVRPAPDEGMKLSTGDSILRE